jgi:hypothetical protein
MAQGMLEQAARMESSADPSVRKVGQEMRARATTVLNNAPTLPAPARQAAPASAAPAVAPAPRPSALVSTTPAATARPEVARHLLADAHNAAALLRTIVLMEALGAPLALRDELGGPFTHR